MISVQGSPLKVYAETSVYGKAFDKEFAKQSQKFFEEVRAGRFELVISPVIEEEMSLAAEDALALFYDFFPSTPRVELSDEAIALRDAYIYAGIVAPESINSAMHVALATISGCSLLTSWDFRNIVHFEKIPKYNAVNVLHDMPPIALYPPSAVILYEQV